MYRRNRAGRLDAGGTRHQLERLEESEREVSPGAARKHLSTIKDQGAGKGRETEGKNLAVQHRGDVRVAFMSGPRRSVNS
jgi:hypothetical protein